MDTHLRTLGASSPADRAHADQVATLYAGWSRTTLSMLFGAALFCAVLGTEVSAGVMLAWVALIVANQAFLSLGPLARDC